VDTRFLMSTGELVVACAEAMPFWGRIPITATVDVDRAVGAAVAALRRVLHDAGTALVAVESVAGPEALERGLRRKRKQF
jgi:hypothetical protein